jgi:toxin secretion/phage lysis holin
MNKIIEFLAVVMAAVAGWFSNMPDVIRVLLLVMMFDIFAGAALAIAKKNLSSSVAWSGVGKKAVTLVVVALTYTVSNMIVGVDLAAPIGQAVAGFYIYVEVVSVLQNAAQVGIPIPDFLKNALDTINPDKNRNQSGAVG